MQGFAWAFLGVSKSQRDFKMAVKLDTHPSHHKRQNAFKQVKSVMCTAENSKSRLLWCKSLQGSWKE